MHLTFRWLLPGQLSDDSYIIERMGRIEDAAKSIQRVLDALRVEGMPPAPEANASE